MLVSGHWADPYPTVLKSVMLNFHTPEYLRLYKRFLDTQPGEDYRFGVVRNDLPRRLTLDQDLWKPCQSYEGRIVDPVGSGSDNGIPWVSDSPTALGWYQYSGKGIDQLVVAGYRNFTGRFGVWGQHTAGLPSMCEQTDSLSFVPKPLGLSTLVPLSLRSMLPHIRAELSLVNSIIELKDFASLKHTIPKLQGTLKNLLRFTEVKKGGLGPNPFSLIRRSFKPEQGLTLRELLHSTADGYLQVQFNLSPLLDDISAVFRAFRDLDKTMNGLVQNQGRPRRKHYTYKWIPSQFTGADASVTTGLTLDQFTGTENNGSPTKIGCYRAYSRQLTCTRQVVVDEPATFHAEVEYKYYLSQYQLEHARVLTLLDKLGVNLSPRIIWNAIPWSFVIDWFIDIGRYLGDRKTLNMEPVINISRYMWSWRASRKVKTFLYDWSPTTGPTQPQCPIIDLPDLYETIYRRDVELPAFDNPLFGSTLDSKELTLGAALVSTKRWRPHRG